MDPRLFEASRTGNLDHLSSLLQTDPLILETLTLETGQTPLHITVISGHLDFAKEIIKLNPSFASEINPNGLTPLHIASAKGELEIVRELMKLGFHLCGLKGRESMIPLHYAVMKGRVEVIKELVLGWPESVLEVTGRRESVLHLAVKNSRFSALMELVERLRDVNKLGFVVNLKDGHGNTVLHVAVATKQFEVVEFILKQLPTTGGTDTLEVNTLNNNGLTALDVLSTFHSQAGDREISDILVRSGALTATTSVVVDQQNTSSSSSETQLKTNSNRWIEYFKFKKDRDNPDNVRSALLVVAALIITATYQAVLQPPGGLWQDTSSSSECINKKSSHQAGKAIMGDLVPISYVLFLFFNSVGFFASFFLIESLTVGFPFRMELKIALYALLATYDICMGALTPNTYANTFFVVMAVLLPIVIPVLCGWIRKLCVRG